MSAFKFPANPSDGDIVVVKLQAYNAATNTGVLAKLDQVDGIPGPPGPAGPPGPPGQGLEVSGIVDTEADLPLPNQHQYEFWFVDDVNEVFLSNGIEWVSAGGPIRGPQGEPGEDGAPGTNGQNGRGWYDTEILTQPDGAAGDAITDYRVRFLSNDGLTFTTDNLKGPSGNDGAPGEDGQDGADFDGQIPLATDNSPGIVQIGSGIDVDSSGKIGVDLNTVELDNGNAIQDFALTFRPFTLLLAVNGQLLFLKRSSKREFYNDARTIQIHQVQLSFK